MAVSGAAVQCWVVSVPVASARQVRFERQGFGLNGRVKSTALMVGCRVLDVQRVYKKQSPSFPSCVRAQAPVFEADSKLLGPVIVIDNYDSFTYNLCQYLGDLGCKYEVYRNDEITIEELKEKNPRGILISPGPGTPQDSGIALQSIVQLGPEVPIFGVCMGLQCMGEAYGGNVVRAPNGVVHGKSSPVHYDEQGEPGLLAELSNPFEAARYHSLVIEKSSFPSEELEITAWTDDGLIMGVRHSKYRHVQGVQFHPESIITPEGKKIVQNFLKIIAQKWKLDGVEQATLA